MDLSWIVIVAAAFAVYIAFRWPFFRLPLHMDTGYYVPNHTICTRTVDFSKGWNATYAGCSKVVPELFYSAIFLLHGGGEKYKFYSRFYYSFYAFGVGLAVGYVAYRINGSDPVAFFVGLVVFGLLSCEPHYGVYFESGEQFELLPQVLGVLMIYVGLDTHSPLIAGAGVGLWVMESYFIKLSSMVSALVLGLGTAYLLPSSILPSLAFSGLATMFYLWWVHRNGQHPMKLLQPLIGHEIHLGHTVGVKTYVKRVLRKVGFLFLICASHPIIPVLAVVGVLHAHSNTPLLILFGLVAVSIPVSFALEYFPALPRIKKKLVLAVYLALLAGLLSPFVSDLRFQVGDIKAIVLALYISAVAFAYLLQAAQVWYYSIPFMPVIALLATDGVLELMSLGTVGDQIIAGLFALWIFMHVWRPYRMTLEQLNTWTWLPHKTVPDRNLQLDHAVAELSRTIQGRSLLVFGHYNQAYISLETSYPTSMITPCDWLDEMHPLWKNELYQLFVLNPPEFILDSDRCFDGKEVQALGLQYSLIKEFPGEFLLYRLTARHAEMTLPQNQSISHRTVVTS
jgi:hypothetical protein